MKSSLSSHWFWKHTKGKNRLLNSDISIDLINQKILFSESIFYILLFVKLSFMMFDFNDYLRLEIIDPLWSVFWINFLPNFPWIACFLVLSFIINLILIFEGASKKLKILLFLSCFVFFSLLNSRGKINHSLHTILIPLFCFIFLDRKKDENRENYNFLIFSSSVFALLMSYFLAGFWKIAKGFHYLHKGEYGIFNIDVFTRMLKYQFRYEDPTIFAAWIMQHENIGFAMIWSGILLEFFSILIFFFGKLHKFWGIGLLFLHISINIIMDVSFASVFITLIPLLILSPFSGEKKVY